MRPDVLSIVLDRTESGSRPGARADGHVVALAVEGGGLRGAVSAGMCIVLEAAGLAPAFDRVYGVSAGALNAAALATRQATLTASHFRAAAGRRVINPARALAGRPVVDYDHLFGELIAVRMPLAFANLAGGPQLGALAISLETGALRILRDFRDADELLLAVRSSAALPKLCGPAPVFRGERMADGGIIEPIPYETALREGASHVLVLRSRPAGFRTPSYKLRAERLGLRDDPEALALVAAHQDAYNRQAAWLDRGGHERITQVAVPDRTRLVGRTETSPERVAAALSVGAAAMTRALAAAAAARRWRPPAAAA